jgi:hypothetical protein
MSLICSLPKDLFHRLLMSWLSHVDVGRLDSAICDTESRKQFLGSVTEFDFVLLNSDQPVVHAEDPQLDSLFRWLMRRGIATSQLPVTDSCTLNSNDRLMYLQRMVKVSAKYHQ